MNDLSVLHREPIHRIPITVVDVETTGLHPVFDRVVEIALVRVVDGRIERQFTSLVNPQRDIPFDAQMIHHITPAMVRDQPPFPSLLEAIAPFLSDTVLVGHNIGFDLGFLRHELRRAGATEPALPAIDTLQLARQHLRLSSYSLTSVARRLGLSGGAHRALGDALLTLEVFTRLVDRIGSGRAPTLEELLNPWRTTDPSVDPRRHVRMASATEEAGPFRAGQRLFLRYQSPTSGLSERVVDVVDINVEYGVPSLYAYCHRSRDMRTFRVDRIVSWQEVDDDSSPES